MTHVDGENTVERLATFSFSKSQNIAVETVSVNRSLSSSDGAARLEMIMMKQLSLAGELCSNTTVDKLIPDVVIPRRPRRPFFMLKEIQNSL